MRILSLTDFVDIVAKSGKSKATRVVQVRDRPDYEPAFDFYKPLRDHLIALHQAGESRNQLDSLLAGLSDRKKLHIYPQLLEGYRKWWGHKRLAWFTPPRTQYTASGLSISINPELGLDINGQRHVIKLYLKNESLSALKVELILELMEHTLRPLLQSADHLSVLDVRHARLFTSVAGRTALLPVVDAELAYIAALWNR